ncbi:hypothetical protein FH972_011288 [Carpinus fangiana]|uniref:DUF547 domain-containing protein n=1 Tax=Carpinus fangiana TaxID=176857 RepID=A0A660KXW2_9ROSI|nr:hypothetical protein FH972_011288 [Carpinus fangiana]
MKKALPANAISGLADREREPDHEEGSAGEREDLQGRQGDGAGVLVGVHQLRHRRGFQQVPEGEAQGRRSWVLVCDLLTLVLCSVFVEFGLNSWVDFEFKNGGGLSISMRFTNYKFEVVFGWKNKAPSHLLLSFQFKRQQQQQPAQQPLFLRVQASSSCLPFPSLPFPCCFSVSPRHRLRPKQLSAQVSLMATPLETSVRKKKVVSSGQQNMKQLEREVSILKKMLNREEKMHEILEHVHNQHDGSAITIPNFLPPKMKEVLAELAMVEDEISRLEGQIRQLQNSLKHEQQLTKEWQHGGTPQHYSPTPINNKGGGGNEMMAFHETKALHFISKAIKGDYNLHHFTPPDHKLGNSRTFHHDHKENHLRTEAAISLRKSGILLKPSSPFRDVRHPSPKPKERSNIPPTILEQLPPKSQANALIQPSEDEEKQQWQPNKLSESIMKCLNVIYTRLLRTSRAMELEKSGPIFRSLMSKRSIRGAETGSKPLLQKESRQQDPYGIFNMEESIPRDIGPYKNLVVFTSTSLDSKSISSPTSIPLLTKLRALMSNLQTVDLRFLTNQQKLAFWINMYNACIMHGFLQYGVPATPDKLLALMNKATLNIGGNIINAQAIEHFILRKPASSSRKEVYRKDEKDDKEAVVRKLYGLESMDPNVIFALSCGTRSSPAVRIYTGDGVAVELEKAKLDYLQASIVVSGTKRIAFPELLLQNMLDFAADTDSFVEWTCQQLPTSGSLRKAMVDCFRGHNPGTRISTVLDNIPYDFEFQYLLAI